MNIDTALTPESSPSPSPSYNSIDSAQRLPSSGISLFSALNSLTPPRQNLTTAQRRGKNLSFIKTPASRPIRRAQSMASLPSITWNIGHKTTPNANATTAAGESPRRLTPSASRTKGSSNSSLRSRNVGNSPRKGKCSPPSPSGRSKRKRTTISSTFGIRSIIGKLKFGGSTQMNSKGKGKADLKAKTPLFAREGGASLFGNSKLQPSGRDSAPLFSPGAASVFGGQSVDEKKLLRGARSQGDLLGRHDDNDINMRTPMTALTDMSVDGALELRGRVLEVQYATVIGGASTAGNIAPLPSSGIQMAHADEADNDADDAMLSPMSDTSDGPIAESPTPRTAAVAYQRQFGGARRMDKLTTILGEEATGVIGQKSLIEGWMG